MTVESSATPSMLVVGGGGVADALESMTAVLGWSCHVTESLDEALDALPAADLVVVLSHHDGVDGPVLAAALDHDQPYIGAMGSRRTQARRREWMLAHGTSEAALARVRGPAGLDIGGNTPAEIAVSIIAEIIGVRSGVAGGSISDREGSIHPTLAPGTAECPAAPATSG